MIAVDTNILVRIVTGEGDEAPRARTFMTDNDVFLGVTVLLEVSWVLWRIYGLSRPAVVGALRGLVGLERVTVERRSQVMQALAWADSGMDVADAFHLALAGEDRPFATFDRRLQRQAAAAGRQVVAP